MDSPIAVRYGGSGWSLRNSNEAPPLGSLIPGNCESIEEKLPASAVRRGGGSGNGVCAGGVVGTWCRGVEDGWGRGGKFRIIIKDRGGDCPTEERPGRELDCTSGVGARAFCTFPKRNGLVSGACADLALPPPCLFTPANAPRVYMGS